MAGKLLNELRQTKPFQSLELEAYLNLIKTADVLQQGIGSLLRPHGLSETQYNVLRILRGAGENGLNCTEIADRMVTRDPDVTRLLDRLEKQSWIERHRSTTDRRVVTSRITPNGMQLLEDLDKPLRESLHRLLGRLGQEKLQSLIELLEEAR